MNVKRYGMSFTVISHLLDNKGRTIEETEWGEFNSYSEAKGIANQYQNERLIFQII